MVDLYIDAYEHVKAKKRCAARIRAMGDPSGEWHDIVEIENAQLLNREVDVFIINFGIFFKKKKLSFRP